MTNEDALELRESRPLIGSELDELEIEFSKVESTLKSLADGVAPAAAAKWLNENNFASS